MSITLIKLRNAVLRTGILLALTISSSVAMADYTKGEDAFNSGNYKTAMAEFMPLAKQGNNLAQFKIAYMYQQGKGTPINLKEALNWYTKSATQGNITAQLNLGILCLTKSELDQTNQAEKWLLMAANNGEDKAQYVLGLMYKDGEGVKEKNTTEAIKWFKKSAAQNNAEAKIELEALTAAIKTKK